MQMHAMLWSLVAQSDITTKAILLFLIGMSILCWSIVFYKYMLFRTMIRQLSYAVQVMTATYKFEDFVTKASLLHTTQIGELLMRYITLAKEIVKAHPATPKNLQLEMMQGHMNVALDETIAQQENYVSILSTCAAVAPLVGLFGTVWGLIHSFLAIGVTKSADIASVAPGMAEALVTTLFGLIVAVPALITYHFLQSKLREIEQHLVALTDKSLMVCSSLSSDFMSIPEKMSDIKTAAIK